MVCFSTGFPKVFRPCVSPETWDYTQVAFPVESSRFELLTRDP